MQWFCCTSIRDTGSQRCAEGPLYSGINQCGGSTAFIRSSIKLICSICSVSAGGLRSGSDRISCAPFFSGCFVGVPTCRCSILKSIHLAPINPAVPVGSLAAHRSWFSEYPDSKGMKGWRLNKHKDILCGAECVCSPSGIYGGLQSCDGQQSWN